MGLIVIILAGLLVFNDEKSREYNIENVAIFTYSPFLNYTFKNEQGADFEIAPTQSEIGGISIKRKEFTYAFGYQTRSDSREDDQRTNFFDIQIATDFDRVLATAYYQNYQGFYLNNDGILNINDKKDISSVSYGINLRYFTKETYDLGSTILSDKKERVSGFSFFHSVYANSTNLKNESNIFQRSGFETLQGLNKMNVINFGYEYGISGTYHLWWMRITGLFSLGYNIHHIHLDKNDSRKNYDGSFSTSAFLDFGLFDFKDISVGFFAKTMSMEFKHKDIGIEQRRASATAYLRYFF